MRIWFVLKGKVERGGKGWPVESAAAGHCIKRVKKMGDLLVANCARWK